MQLCYFSNNTIVYGSHATFQHRILFCINTYLFFSLSVVIVTTCSYGAKAFLSRVFHAQSGPQTEGLQHMCLFCNSCCYLEKVTATACAEEEEEERVTVLCVVLPGKNWTVGRSTCTELTSKQTNEQTNKQNTVVVFKYS